MLSNWRWCLLTFQMSLFLSTSHLIVLCDCLLSLSPIYPPQFHLDRIVIIFQMGIESNPEFQMPSQFLLYSHAGILHSDKYYTVNFLLRTHRTVSPLAYWIWFASSSIPRPFAVAVVISRRIEQTMPLNRMRCIWCSIRQGLRRRRRRRRGNALLNKYYEYDIAPINIVYMDRYDALHCIVCREHPLLAFYFYCSTLYLDKNV